jgi:K+-transporting ATPase ATPase C chain
MRSALFGRHLVASLIMLLTVTVVLGFGYPLVVTGLSQLFFKDKANGSLVYRDGKLVGSSLLGQEFTTARATRSRSTSSRARRPRETGMTARRLAPATSVRPTRCSSGSSPD